MIQSPDDSMIQSLSHARTTRSRNDCSWAAEAGGRRCDRVGVAGIEAGAAEIFCNRACRRAAGEENLAGAAGGGRQRISSWGPHFKREPAQPMGRPPRVD